MVLSIDEIGSKAKALQPAPLEHHHQAAVGRRHRQHGHQHALIASTTERMEISNMTKAITETKTKTSTWVCARSSKSLISAVGPPTSIRTPAVHGSLGSVARSQSIVSRARISSGSTASTAESRALRLSSENTGGATETMLTACPVTG